MTHPRRFVENVAIAGSTLATIALSYIARALTHCALRGER